MRERGETDLAKLTMQTAVASFMLIVLSECSNVVELIDRNPSVSRALFIEGLGCLSAILDDAVDGELRHHTAQVTAAQNHTDAVDLVSRVSQQCVYLYQRPDIANAEVSGDANGSLRCLEHSDMTWRRPVVVEWILVVRIRYGIRKWCCNSGSLSTLMTMLCLELAGAGSRASTTKERLLPSCGKTSLASLQWACRSLLR